MTQSDDVHLVVSPRRPRRWLRVLLLLCILFGGIVIGVAGTVVIAAHRIKYVIRHPEEAPDRITARLKRRLRLTDAQAVRMREVLARRQAALQDIRRGVQPKVEAELDATEKEIADLLTPGQASDWQGVMSNIRENWLPPPPPARSPDGPSARP